MTTPSPDQIKTLEQSRQRLAHLTRSLASLVGSLSQSDPLPTWSSLQSQANIISNNLISVSEHLTENADLLTSLVAFPGPDYPGRTQANTLEQLLRTKLDPRVEDWVARGRKAGNAAVSGGAGETLSERDLAELWDWAPVAANEEARRRNWGGNFTLEEKEMGVQNVVTGLRRQLEEDDDDEDEEDEDEEGEEDEMEVVGVRKSGSGAGLEFDIAAATVPQTQQHGQQMEAVAPVVPLEEILRFMTTGAPPGPR